MASIKDFQEQLLTTGADGLPLMDGLQDGEEGIIVFKNYRFHRQLTVELYKAFTTREGKLKNPLTPVNPFDAVLQTDRPEEIRFFSAVGRFQNNPTEGKSPLAITALKLILQNPFGFRYFCHNPDFSANVVAGSLQEVSVGSVVDNLVFHIRRKDTYFEMVPELVIDGASYSFGAVDVLYDYFIRKDKTIHLLNHFHFLKVARFFKQHPSGLKLHESRFEEFRQGILAELQDAVTIRYTDAAAPLLSGNEKSLGEKEDMLLYLTDLGPHVGINPVLRYGGVEIPVRSKRQIYLNDAEGRLLAFQRNDAAEDHFIALLLKQHPHFTEQLSNDLTYFYLHKKRFLDSGWFLDAFEQWQAEGITVLGFSQLKGNKQNPHKAKITVHVNSGLNWFNTQLEVRFGKKKADLKKLQQSVRNKSRYVPLDDGTFGLLPEDWLQKLSAYFEAGEIEGDALLIPKINFLRVKQLYTDEELDESVRNEIQTFEKKLAGGNELPEVEVPSELQATLRHYQKQGLGWLNLLDAFNFGGILADDMGLGKTIQVIAFILAQREKTPHNTNLVVVPTSLLFNWQVEVRKFAPTLRMLTIYGSTRVRDVTELDAYEVVLTSYGTLLSDINYLKGYTFNYIFLDESQNIKNIDSQRYHTVRQLQARNRVAITGTPVENNTLDLYAQLSFACPGLLGSRQSFRDLFSIPIDKFQSSKHAAGLQRVVAPFILRRTKEEVVRELPQKTEMTLYCPMGEAQRSVYDAYEKEFRDYISGKTAEELSQNSVHILRSLTRLRQICDSPLLLEDEKLYGDSSSKLEALLEQIELKTGNHKVLVFSQFVSMLQLIRKELDKRSIAYEYLTGSTRDREAVVNHFQTNGAVRVFLISLKAGGTGLNLTEADTVFLVDPWWNPAVENQAIDRCYRIGQVNNVVAYRLICPDTLEEKMVKLQERKRSLSEGLVKTETSFFQSITKDEWMSFFERDS